MLGVIVTIVVMVLFVPIAIMLAGAVWSALFGWVGSEDAERSVAPSETDA